jgi:outer membrane protein OmpA-like peptidoglycan-associated protein
MTLFRHLLVLLCIYSNAVGFANNNSERHQLADFNASPASDTVIIRFDYKQSALYHQFTFDVLDSIIRIMQKDTAVRLSIDGYAYKDEGTDTICYYLSLNRALFIQTYFLGRGIDSSKITSLTAHGKRQTRFNTKDKDGHFVNCRAELQVIYPPKKIDPNLLDRDEDGIVDVKDKCPDNFGHLDNLGCPRENFIIVPFPVEESALYAITYRVLDSVVLVLRENPALTITIDGHAIGAEASYSVCERLAKERAEIVKQYLLSRQINADRILAVKSYGMSRPLNAGKTPLDVIKNARAEITLISKL